ncbi:Na+/H+ antiporter subunit E [Pseudokordiimonas caeni]|uniref:Na+/H+ antiporter subunit E n=1 Tax=Pseudokordiimonas caeni TaxID=2997908 RepID=UPI0028114A61|nr:Na+/H+ antiporter subunit E [Pseudokordiimonas caeni]
MKHLLVLLVALGAIWLLWSGIYTPLLLAFGLVSCLIVALLAWRMGLVDREAVPFHLHLKVIPYWGWLVKEMLVSSLAVTRLILTPGVKLMPEVVRLKTAKMEDVTRVTLANSITLTPGTVTLDVNDDEILVHCLTADGAKDLLAGGMAARVVALEN